VGTVSSVTEKYPKVLVVALARINASDTFNNALLLRDLFAGWPRERLAQIYSSNDNGDKGFFGSYYQLSKADRRFGGLFYPLKELLITETSTADHGGEVHPAPRVSFLSRLKKWLITTGAYELLFRPVISKGMRRWIKEYNPDIIFAQGYCLTFAWLPVMIKKETGAKMAYLTTDDWPTSLRLALDTAPGVIRKRLTTAIDKATEELIGSTDVPFAFGPPMAQEYAKRYRREFIPLLHADDPERFDRAIPKRSHPHGVFSIVVAGYFDETRWQLLLDADECCAQLQASGINARVAVLAVGIEPEGERELAKRKYIDILKDPGHCELPSRLKGADLLLLAETFDKKRVEGVRLSVSSKSHLFMFSRRPIVVYADRETGVANYAMHFGWAKTVTERNPRALADAIAGLAGDPEERAQLVAHAAEVAAEMHSRTSNQMRFLEAMKSAIHT
jgi:glycosyltransferase involved in cell wall biosynthesis